MIAAIVALLGALRSSCRPQAELVVENLALRHQLAVLRHQAPVGLRLRRLDRVFWVVLSRVSSGWRQAVQVVPPDTVVGWHRLTSPHQPRRAQDATARGRLHAAVRPRLS
jgi:hypothetical protein